MKNNLDKIMSAMVTSTCFSLREICNAQEVLSAPIEDQVYKIRCELDKTVSKFTVDVAFGYYKGKSVDKYEELRKRALKKLEMEEDVNKAINDLMESAKELDEAIRMLAYNEIFKMQCDTIIRLEICTCMIREGMSLSDIVRYVPDTDILDVYLLGKEHLGIKWKLSDEEKKQLEKRKLEKEETVDLKQLLLDIEEK